MATSTEYQSLQCHRKKTDLDVELQLLCFLLILGQVGLEPSDLVLLVMHGFVQRLQLLADPPVPLLLRPELVATALLGVQFLAALLSQCQPNDSKKQRGLYSLTLESLTYSVRQTARTDDDADAKMIRTAAPPDNWKRPDHQSIIVSRGEHRSARSESLQPHIERSSRPGPEPSSVEADVYIWRYALLVVYARKEEC